MAIGFQTKADAAVPVPASASQVYYYVDNVYNLLSAKIYSAANPSTGTIVRLANLPLPNRIVAHAHSYLTAFGNTRADKGIGAMLAGLLHGNVENMGVGGAQIGQDDNNATAGQGTGGWARTLQNSRLVPPRTAAPYVPNGYLGLLVYGINDIGFHHAEANARAVFKHAMRTCISRMCASAVFEDSDASIVYAGSGGTWQTAVSSTAPGGTSGVLSSGVGYRAFPGNGATFTITIPSDFEGGAVAAGLIAFPNSDAVITWSGTASAATGTTTLVGQAYATAGSGNTRSSPNGLVARFNCLASDAGKTIIGTVGSMAGTTQASPVAPIGSTITACTFVTTTITCTVASNAGLTVGQVITVAGVAGFTTNNPNGNWTVASLISTNQFTFVATLAPTGSYTASSGNVKGMVVNGTPGAVTYGYKWVFVNQNGDTIPGTEVTIATGNATLTGVNSITVGPPGAFPAGVVGAKLLRTTGGANNGGQGLIATVATNVAFTDIGTTPTAYTANTLNPQVAGGAFDYWQIESNTPTTMVGVANIVRCLAAGYGLYPGTGTVAITSGGGVGSSSVTPTGGVPASVLAGSTIGLTGGTTEFFKVLSVGGGAINLVGTIINAGHTTVSYGLPSDNDVVNYNTDLVALCAEFVGGAVFYIDVDTQVNLNQFHYFSDGVHLNDRGSALFVQATWTPLVAIALSQPISSIAQQSRQLRRPENHVFLPALAASLATITISSTSYAILQDSNGVKATLIIEASPGDDLEICVGALWNTAAIAGILDVATLTAGGAILNTASGLATTSTTNLGIASLFAPISVQMPVSATIIYTATLADVVNGVVGLAIIGKLGAAGSRTLIGIDSGARTTFTAKNMGAPSYLNGM